MSTTTIVIIITCSGPVRPSVRERFDNICCASLLVVGPCSAVEPALSGTGESCGGVRRRSRRRRRRRRRGRVRGRRRRPSSTTGVRSHVSGGPSVYNIIVLCLPLRLCALSLSLSLSLSLPTARVISSISCWLPEEVR